MKIETNKKESGLSFFMNSFCKSVIALDVLRKMKNKQEKDKQTLLAKERNDQKVTNIKKSKERYYS